MPFGLGFGETLLILAVILLFFGPKRLPEAAASLGKGIREFKRAMSSMGDELATPANTVAYTPPRPAAAYPGADPNAIPSHAPPEPVAEASGTGDPATAAIPAAHPG